MKFLLNDQFTDTVTFNTPDPDKVYTWRKVPDIEFFPVFCGIRLSHDKQDILGVINLNYMGSWLAENSLHGYEIIRGIGEDIHIDRAGGY